MPGRKLVAASKAQMPVDMAGPTQQEVVSVFIKLALAVFVSLAISSQTFLALLLATMTCVFARISRTRIL